MYDERPSSIQHAVAWTATAETDEDHRVLPDGCMDLIWQRGQLIVAGPDTAAHITTWTPNNVLVGLRFGAGLGPRVVGIPAYELRDQRVALDDLWSSAGVRRLTECLAAAADPAAMLEGVAADRLRTAPPPDPIAAHVVRRLGQGASVGAVASDVGLSARQLHRRSLDAFGYGPKTLARILRMNQAVTLRRAGTSPVEAAVAAGYADQAHLARDVRSLTGVTLTTLVA